MTDRSFLRKPFRYEYFNAALILIVINLAFFLLRNMAPRWVLPAFAMIPLRVVREKTVWQFVTYMFIHADLSHLFFNMLGLYFFGTQIERQMGSREFLLFYLLTGLVAGIFSFIAYWLSGAYLVFLMGASGAIYAVLLAFAVYFPSAVIYVMGIIPVRAPLLVTIYAGMEIFSQVAGRGGNVAHLTHLAGLGAAYLYFLIRLRINPLSVFLHNRRW